MTAYHYSANTTPDPPKNEFSNPSANILLHRSKYLINPATKNLQSTQVRNSSYSSFKRTTNKKVAKTICLPENNLNTTSSDKLSSSNADLRQTKSSSLLCSRCQGVILNSTPIKFRAYKSLRQPQMECVNARRGHKIHNSIYNFKREVNKPKIEMVLFSGRISNGAMNTSNQPNKLSTNHDILINQYALNCPQDNSNSPICAKSNNYSPKTSHTPIKSFFAQKLDSQHLPTQIDQISSQAALNKVFFPHRANQISHNSNGLSKNFAVFNPRQTQIIQNVAGKLRVIGDEFDSKYNPKIKTDIFSYHWQIHISSRHLLTTSNIMARMFTDLLFGSSELQLTL